MSESVKQNQDDFLKRENRMIYDRRRVEACSIQKLAFEHPDWSYEKRREEGLKEENVQRVIRDRMIADLADRMIISEGEYASNDFFIRQATWIIDHMPEELRQNVNEYIEGDALSDIKLHGISVLDVMHQFDDYKIGFTRAMKCMCYWKETEYKDSDFCKNFFSQM